MTKPISDATAKLAPDFVLKDTAGEEFRLSDFIGKSPVVLVFNRGFT
jgi:peroxiredoxin